MAEIRQVPLTAPQLAEVRRALEALYLGIEMLDSDDLLEVVSDEFVRMTGVPSCDVWVRYSDPNTIEVAYLGPIQQIEVTIVEKKDPDV